MGTIQKIHTTSKLKFILYNQLNSYKIKFMVKRYFFDKVVNFALIKNNNKKIPINNLKIIS